jgi:hypothetical protein
MGGLGLLTTVVLASCGDSKTQLGKVDFATQIKPLLESQCVNCHQSGALMGNLNLENHALATKAHPHGDVIKPGDPEHSLLYRVLTLPEVEKQAMPPGGHRIEKEKVELIKLWITQGAVWPDGAGGVVRPKVDPAVRVGTKA